MKVLKAFLICVSIFQVICDAASESTVRKGRRRGHRNSTLSKSRLKNFRDAYRVYGGQNAQINSMCMGMSSASYYELIDNAYFLNFSPQCFISSAYIFADTSTTPPTVDKSSFYTGLCVRPDCDFNYHPSEIILNDVNYFDIVNYKNNIALFKTKKPVFYDNRCGGPPLEPAWISCDKNGPPANYTDCFFASFGQVNEQQNSLSEDAPINTLKMRTLSASDCQKLSLYGDTPINYNPTAEICVTDPDNLDPICISRENFYNPFLFCKYWDNGHSSNNGWKTDHSNKGQGTNNSKNGWGWNPSPKKQNLLAVGHYQEGFGGACGPDAKSVDILVKYGAQIYRNMFAKCGYYCSSELEKGYRCKGNPPKSLGPVYCYPEKIPINNGWSSPGNSNTGWSS